MPDGVGAPPAAGGNGGAAPSGGSTAPAEPTFTYGGGQPIDSGAQGGDNQPDLLSNDAIDTGAQDTDDFPAFDDDPDLGEGDEAPKKADYKSLTEQLRSQDPKIAKTAEKQLKRTVMENERYKAIAESPEKLRETFDKLDTYGGVEGIEAEMQEWATAWTGFQAGDPAVLDEWFKENPAGMNKLVPAALNKFREQNPQGWNHEMAKVFMSTLTQTNALQSLGMLADLPGIKDNPQAQKLLNSFFEVVEAVDGHAKNAPKDDPGIKDQALSKREQKVQQEEQRLYRQTMNSKVEPVMSKMADNALAAILKGKNISAQAKADLRADVFREFATLNQKDATFVKNATALYNAKDMDKFVKFVRARAEQVMPRAAQRVWRKYSGITGLSQKETDARKADAQSRRESGAGGTGTSAVKTGKPAPQEIDWQAMRARFGGRDKAEDKFMEGMFMKKGDSKTLYTFR